MWVQHLKFVALPVPEIIAIGVLGGELGLRTRNLGEDEAVGVGDGTVRKSVSKFL